MMALNLTAAPSFTLFKVFHIIKKFMACHTKLILHHLKMVDIDICSTNSKKLGGESSSHSLCELNI